MSDLDRGAWTWDRIWIGCGASKRAVRCQAGEMYTGPVFAAHAAIVAHLGFPEPEILSAKYGLIPWTTEIDTYEATLEHADDRRRFSAGVLREVEAEVALIHRYRGRVGIVAPATIDGRWPPRKTRDDGFGGDRLWCGCTWPCREGHGNAFGPVQQPSILVLAGAPYIDGWIEQARAMGVRVDDPLRGYTLGDRRLIARRFCAETPRWSDEGQPEWGHDGAHLYAESAPGWGTPIEQLQSFLADFDFARAEMMLEVPAVGPEQLGLWGGAQ